MFPAHRHPDYTYTGWSSEPESVVVCGTKEALSEVDEIEVNASEIDISGASSRVEQTVDISPYLPDGIKLVDETTNKVAVTAMVEQEGGRTITLPVGAIRVTNLAENLKVSVESDADLEVQFTGKEELLKNGADYLVDSPEDILDLYEEKCEE